MSVLLVDDDRAFREVYARLLEREGFSVTTVDNGLAAFSAVQRQAFTAIVCDIRMPFLEGRSFYRELREHFPEMADRVVFVTGLGHDDRTRQLVEETGQPVLQKPVEFTDLVATLRRIGDG